MDFEKLLRVARKNELHKKEPVKCLQTKFKPPTKEQHDKDRVLSEGVQRFLARKEEEEKRKQMEAEKKKQELLSLRAKDPKANKRIQTMLKRTKSANKSVMEDAVDNNNTADTLAGPSQPDEDDYGFVSESSSQLYNKLIQKMYSTPSDDAPKFAPSKKPSTSNLSNTKERVKMALLKQEEEEKLPHKRKRKNRERREEDEEDLGLNYSAPDRNLSLDSQDQNKGKMDMEYSHDKKADKPKVKKRPLPPTVDFQELLRIAEEKQYEPIVLENKKPQEPEVLMTKKQKIEYEKMQEWKRRRELRLQSLEKGEKFPASEDKKPLPKIPKVNASNSDDKVGNVTPIKKVNGLDVGKIKYPEKSSSPTKRSERAPKFSGGQGSCERKVGAQEKKPVDEETTRLIRERNEALRILKEKERLIRERDEAVRKLKEKEQLIRERDEAVRKLKLLEEGEKVKNSVKSTDTPILKSISQTQKLKAAVKNSETVKSCSMGNPTPKISPGLKKNDLTRPGLKPTESRRDLKPLTKGATPLAGRPRSAECLKQFPPADVRRKALALKRRRIESDDEYDSELDDFIDDDDNQVPSEEVSKVISEIFKYDKNKYSMYDDADDECMVSNFAQISKEEFFSTKCGILEDLKDVQREKAKLSRKSKR